MLHHDPISVNVHICNSVEGSRWDYKGTVQYYPSRPSQDGNRFYRFVCVRTECAPSESLRKRWVFAWTPLYCFGEFPPFTSVGGLSQELPAPCGLILAVDHDTRRSPDDT